MFPHGKIFPLAVHKDGPAKLDQAGVDRRFGPRGKEALFAHLLDFGGNRGLPGLKGMGMAAIENDVADDTGVGFGNEKGGAGGHRFRVDPDRIGVEGKSSRRRFIEHEEKGGPEALVLVPFRMSG